MNLILRYQETSDRLYSVAICLGITLTVFVLYYQGIHSVFLLDDEVNLQGLALIDGGILSESFWDYVFSGTAGPTGRPVSLFSLALQSQSWPDSPHTFKLVNILIHSVNAVLVFLMVRLATSVLGIEKKKTILLAALVAFLWAVHPINITSVLYVIQRMASLSATFGLLSCVLYLRLISRGAIEQQPPSLRSLFGVLIALSLSILSKENGILFCGYMLCIQFFLRKQTYWTRQLRVFGVVAFCLPLVLLCGYLIMSGDKIMGAYENRDFSLPERLMTEARVLWSYVSAILLPSFGKYGLLNDDYLVSRSIFDPLRTLISIVGWCTCLASLFVRRIPAILKLSIGWFLIGHFLESTFIGLEIYFEHRNYVASIGFIVAIATAVFYVKEVIVTRLMGTVFYGASLFLVLNILMITYTECRLWSQPLKQAYVWIEDHPDSYRARKTLTNRLIHAERYMKADAQLTFMIERWPNEARPLLKREWLRCFSNQLEKSDLSVMDAKISNVDFMESSFYEFRNILTLKRQGQCSLLTYEYLHNLLSMIYRNDGLGRLNYLPILMKAKLYYYDKEFALGKESFRFAFELSNDLGVLVSHAVLLANNNFIDDAKIEFDKIKVHSDWPIFRKSEYANTLTELELILYPPE